MWARYMMVNVALVIKLNIGVIYVYIISELPLWVTSILHAKKEEANIAAMLTRTPIKWNMKPAFSITRISQMV